MAGQSQSVSSPKNTYEAVLGNGSRDLTVPSLSEIKEVSKIADAQLPGLSTLQTDIERRRLLATAEALEKDIEKTLSQDIERARVERSSSIKDKVLRFKDKLERDLPFAPCVLVPAVVGFLTGIIGLAASAPPQGQTGTPNFSLFLAVPILAGAGLIVRTLSKSVYKAFLELWTPLKQNHELSLEEPQQEALRLSRDISKKADGIARDKKYSGQERDEVFSLLVKKQVEILRLGAEELGKIPPSISKRSLLD